MPQSHEILDVRKNGAFIFTDILLIDFRQQKLGQLLNEIKVQANTLEHMVKRYTSNDERLLGQEKANVANALHMLIRNLAALYMRLFEQDHAAMFNHELEVAEGKEGFLIKGKMDPNEVNTRFSVKHWVTAYLEGALINLFRHLQQAAADHQITTEEKVGLTGDLAPMLVKTIQAFYLIRTGAVFH